MFFFAVFRAEARSSAGLRDNALNAEISTETRDGERELLVDLSADAAQECHGNEDRGQNKCDGHHRRGTSFMA